MLTRKIGSVTFQDIKWALLTLLCAVLVTGLYLELAMDADQATSWATTIEKNPLGFLVLSATVVIGGLCGVIVYQQRRINALTQALLRASQGKLDSDDIRRLNLR